MYKKLHIAFFVGLISFFQLPLKATYLREMRSSLVKIKAKLSKLSSKLNDLDKTTGKETVDSQLQNALEKLYERDIITYGTMKYWSREYKLNIYNKVDRESLEFLKIILGANDQLASVNLPNVSIENNLLEELLKVLSNQKRLKNLTLRAVELRPNNLKLFSSFSSLKHLDLTLNNLRGADFSPLELLKNLKKLKLQDCKLTNQQIDSIAKQISITDFDLIRNSFSDGLIQSLSPLQNITELRLEDMNLSINDSKQLASLKNLKKLALSMCGLTDDKLEPLKRCSKIEILDLSYNKKITAIGVSQLEALQRLKRLSVYRCFNEQYPGSISRFKHIGWGLYIPEADVAQQKTRTINYSQLSYKGTIPNIEWRSNWCFMDAVVTCLAFIEPLYDYIDNVELPDISEIKTKLAVDLINKLKFLLTYLRTTKDEIVKAENGPMQAFYNAWITWSKKQKGSTGDSSVFLKDLFLMLKQFQIGSQNEYFTFLAESVIGMPESEISDYKSFAVTSVMRKTKVPLQLDYDDMNYRLVAKVFGRTGHATAMVVNGDGKIFYYNGLAGVVKEVTMKDLTSYSYDNKPTMICFYVRVGK